MIEREKVIKGLEYHLKELTVGKTCYECPYCGDNSCEIQLIANAISLLKEQEPRVLTLEELKTIGDKDAVYLETIVMNLGEPNVKPAIYQPDNSDDEYVCVVSTWFKSGFYSPHNYLKSWRCWSSRPTDEQREAVKWYE